MEELHKNKDYYELDATSEAVYLFQEKLIFKDFASLYNLYLDRTGSGGYEEGGETYSFDDRHPRILEKYREEIDKRLKVFLSSNRFDL